MPIYALTYKKLNRKINYKTIMSHLVHSLFLSNGLQGKKKKTQWRQLKGKLKWDFERVCGKSFEFSEYN